MRISDWSSDVCSSDLQQPRPQMLEPPAIEGDLRDIVTLVERVEPVRHELVFDRSPRRRLQQALVRPNIIGTRSDRDFSANPSPGSQNAGLVSHASSTQAIGTNAERLLVVATSRH